MTKLDKTVAGSLITFVVTTVTWMTYVYVEGLTNPPVSYGGVLGYVMAIAQVGSVASAIVATTSIFVKFFQRSAW